MRAIAVLLLTSWLMALASTGQKPAHAQGHLSDYRTDNSDWWSLIRAGDANEGITAQKREPAMSNLTILGIRLSDDNLFAKVSAKLGNAQKVSRGDASAGRSQVCYSSIEDHPRIHVAFESGEVSDGFYLFADGPDWKDSNLCVKSNLVTENLSLASGLRLGQTPAEVKAILGTPSAVKRNKIVYSYEVEKKTADRDFEKLKQQYPALSDEELHRNYGFYSLSVYLEARFTQSRLTYLGVLKAEAY